MDEEFQIDAGKVIDRLSQELAVKSKEMAILQVTAEELQNVIDKQRKLIEAYEETEGSSE